MGIGSNVLRNPRTSNELNCVQNQRTSAYSNPQPRSVGSDFRLKHDGELWQAMHASKSAFTVTAMISFTINLLMLNGPLFMLQVYDRVMISGSILTLAALSILTGSPYAAIELVELARS